MTKEAPQKIAQKDGLPEGSMAKDCMREALLELYYIDNPTVAKSDAGAAERAEVYARSATVGAIWIYFPWRNTALRIPDENTYYRLRTSRNRDIISEDEQRAFRDAHVGIAGLSVGSAAVDTLVATGGPKRMRIADPDVIEITNLNRIRAVLPDVGQNKSTIAARRIWELDPFADIDVWPQGVSANSMTDFVRGLDVVVDEMDNVAMKIALREVAREAKIPVVMATDNGDGAII